MSLSRLVEQHLGLTSDALLQLSDDQVQVQLAKKLRLLAIQHLREADTELANHFRKMKDFNKFLDKQAKDREWATDDAARALAEIFGFNLDITVTQQKGEGLPESVIMTRYENFAHPIRTDKTLHLYNSQSKGKHWYIADYYYNTKGGGNCLYNAFAQCLQQFVREEVRPQDAKKIKDDAAINVIISQLKIISQFEDPGFIYSDDTCRETAIKVFKQLTESASQEELKNLDVALNVGKVEMNSVKKPGILSKLYTQPKADVKKVEHEEQGDEQKEHKNLDGSSYLY